MRAASFGGWRRRCHATTGGFANSYSYNANGEQAGRTVGGVSHTLGWDYDGQLTSIAWGGNTTSFEHDALGRRCSRTAGGVTTAFHHAGSAIIVEKQGTTTTAAYTYGNSLVRKDGEVPLYDGLGSARAQTSSQQSVTATLMLDGFGQTVASTGSTTSPYGYAGDWGYRTEGDAGLMHVGARYYDAQVARFVSRDTYLDQHPYLYCEHDGVNWVDPSGHAAAPSALLPALLGGAAGGVAVGAWDIIEDGEFDRPLYQYGIGIGVGAVVGVVAGAGALPAGVAIGGVIAVKIGLHPANHYFPRFGEKLRHIQIIRWFPPIRGSDKSWRIPLPRLKKWF